MFDVVTIPSNELFAVLTAISFAAGTGVYATVATLGSTFRRAREEIDLLLH
jgi:hypothetical protein